MWTLVQADYLIIVKWVFSSQKPVNGRPIQAQQCWPEWGIANIFSHSWTTIGVWSKRESKCNQHIHQLCMCTQVTSSWEILRRYNEWWSCTCVCFGNHHTMLVWWIPRNKITSSFRSVQHADLYIIEMIPSVFGISDCHIVLSFCRS